MPRGRKEKDTEPKRFPCVILVDSREQLPYSFEGITCDAKENNAPLLVETKRQGLWAGDYSLAGFENDIAVERKSLIDFFGTMGNGRTRFQKELYRLAKYRFAVVMVEASWERIFSDPPDRSQLNPKTAYRSIIAWQQRIRNVHWWFCEGRAFAERTTFRILQRYWIDNYLG